MPAKTGAKRGQGVVKKKLAMKQAAKPAARATSKAVSATAARKAAEVLKRSRGVMKKPAASSWKPASMEAKAPKPKPARTNGALPTSSPSSSKPVGKKALPTSSASESKSANKNGALPPNSASASEPASKNGSVPGSSASSSKPARKNVALPTRSTDADQLAFYRGLRPGLKAGDKLFEEGVASVYETRPYVDTQKDLYWGPSSLGPQCGHGVFTKKAFSKGDLVDICPLIVDYDDRWQPEQADYDAAQHDFYTIEYRPRESRFREGSAGDRAEKRREKRPRSALMLGMGSLYNHVKNPNLEVVWGAVDTVLFVARRDIAPHDELFIDYGDAYWKDMDFRQAQ